MKAAALVFLVFAATTSAYAQDVTFQVAPGGAMTGFDSQGNFYNGTVAPGGSYSAFDEHGNYYSGTYDQSGNMFPTR